MKDSIYSKELESLLAKIGNDFERKFVRTAQENPGELPEVQLSAAKKLISRLLPHYDQVNHPVPAKITGNDGTRLTMANLTNLGNLVQFIADNNIQIDGQPIAVAYPTDVSNPGPLATQFLNDMQQNVIRISSITGQQINTSTKADEQTYKSYLAWMPRLAQYIKDLQDKAKNNEVLEVIIGNLVTRLKQMNPGKFSGLQGRASSDNGGNGNGGANANDTFDQFDNLNLGDADQSGSQGFPDFIGSGPKLFRKDLGSRPAFTAWKTANKITTDGDNACKLLQILYRRSLVYISKSQDEKQKAKFEQYKQMLVALGSSVTNPDGSACDVTSGTSGNGNGKDNGSGANDKNPNGSDKGDGKDGQGRDRGDGSGPRGGVMNAGQYNEMFDNIIKRFPLDRTEINIMAIGMFSQYISTQLPTLFPDAEEYATKVQNAQQLLIDAFGKARDLLINENQAIPFGERPEIVGTMLKARNTSYVSLMYELEKILVNYITVVNIILTWFKGKMSSQQIASFTSQSYLYKDNLNSINNYIAAEKVKVNRPTITTHASLKEKIEFIKSQGKK